MNYKEIENLIEIMVENEKQQYLEISKDILGKCKFQSGVNPNIYLPQITKMVNNHFSMMRDRLFLHFQKMQKRNSKSIEKLYSINKFQINKLNNKLNKFVAKKQHKQMRVNL